MATTNKNDFAREFMMEDSLASPDEYAGAKTGFASSTPQRSSTKRNANSDSMKLSKYHFAEAEMAPSIPPPTRGVVSKKSGR